MTPKEIFEKLKLQIGDALTELKIEAVVEPFAKIRPDLLRPTCLFLRGDPDLQFDYLMCLSGVDYGKGILGVVYHLASIAKKHKITLKVEMPAEKAEISSVSDIWESANWHEREAYDMFGVNFTGHPDLRRILLPEDWPGHPLRKDFKVPEFYRGMKVPY
jgi:NADH-quinone oxidoreductase subunit C